jgi:hypothetical protein
MVSHVVVALLGLALPVTGFQGVQKHFLRKEDDTAYTLVQYQGMACQADKYVCQHLTKGACTVTTAGSGGVSFQVYSELVDDADGTFTVKACEKSGCDCTYTTKWTPNDCSSGTYGGTTLSYQLVPGEIEGCITYDFDVAGGRHHDAYESAMQNTSSFKADEETDDAGLIQHRAEPSKTNVTAEAPVMDVAGPVASKETSTPKEASAALLTPLHHKRSLADFYADWAHEEQTPPGPEQGFEGESVQHEDFETQTDDFRKEYGPDMYDYSGKPKPKEEPDNTMLYIIIGVAVVAVLLGIAGYGFAKAA